MYGVCLVCLRGVWGVCEVCVWVCLVCEVFLGCVSGMWSVGQVCVCQVCGVWVKGV